MTTRKRGSTFIAALFSAALLLGAGATAHALSYSTTLDGASCASCFGNDYTLTVTEVSSNPGITTYDVLYSVDTATDSSQLNNYINAVAFKVSNFADIDTAPTVSGVPFFTTVILDGLSASACGSGGPSGFICSGSSGLGALVDGSTYDWTFSGLKLKTGTLFTDVTDWSIKALYVDGTGKQTGITSENGVVPVPGTLLMFGLGFALLIGWHYRSRHRMGRAGFAA